MSFTWVMEPPLWETEESECILVPGMPLVMLPPWTAEIGAGKKIRKKAIHNNNANNFLRMKRSKLCDFPTAVTAIMIVVMGIFIAAII